MTKDEPVDLFLKETENTPDGDFAAQLDLFYDVTRLTAERRKAFTAVFKEVDEDDSGGPLRPPPPSPPLRAPPPSCRPPRLALLVVCAQCRRAHPRALESARASGWCRRTDAARCAKRVSEYEAVGGCMQRSNRRSCTTSALHSTRSGRAPRARRSSTRSTATRCRCGQFRLQCAQSRCRCGCIQDGNLSIDEFLAFFGQLVEKLNDQQVNKGPTVRCRCRAHPMLHGFPRGIE